MNNIALYNTIRKIPEVTDDEAKEAVADVASSKKTATKVDIKEMATKTDVAELKTEMAEQETRLIAEMSNLKIEMHRLNNRTIMWICGFIIGYSVFVLGIVQLFMDKP